MRRRFSSLVSSCWWFLRPRRRWARFSLATLLLVVTAASVWLAFVTERARKQVALVRKIERLGGSVFYSHHTNEYGDRLPIGDWSDPPLLVRWLGKGYADLSNIWLATGGYSDSDFDVLGNSTQLQRLGVRPPLFNDARLLRLRRLRRLTSINLKASIITDAGMAALADMHDLKYLALDEAPIVGPGLVHLADKSRLVHLSLANTDVSDDGLAHLSGLTALEHLDLRNTEVTDQGIAHLQGLVNLTQLDLGGTQVTDDGLRSLSGLTKLNLLSLNNTAVAGPGLANLARMKGLIGLILDHTRIDDAGIRYLPNLNALQFVALSNTSVGDASAVHLARYRTLLDVRLEGTLIGDDGAEALSQLPALQSVRISRSKISDRGFIALSSPPTLFYLELDDCPITDNGLDGASRAVQNLLLRRTDVTEQGLDRYKRRLAASSPIHWSNRPRIAHAARRADLTPLTVIGDNDSADVLWERAATLAIANPVSIFPGNRPELWIPHDRIDAVFQAAVERSDRPAPILVCWGDLGASARSLLATTAIVESRSSGHPEESVLREVLKSGNPDLVCYAAAAAIEPDYAAPWHRLTYGTLERDTAEACVRRDPDNALAYYLCAAALNESAAPDELLGWLQQGHGVSRIEGFPTPLPPSAYAMAKAPSELNPTHAGPLVLLHPARRRHIDGYEHALALISGRALNSEWFNQPDAHPHVYRNLIRAYERLRGASPDSNGPANAWFDKGLLQAALPRAQAIGDASTLAKVNKLLLGWNAMPSPFSFSAPDDRHLRLHRLLPDLLATRRAEAEELRKELAKQGIDGSLEWLAELFP